jgi:hypothetical protein
MAKEISPREAERRRLAALKAQEGPKPHEHGGGPADPHKGRAQKSAKQRIQRHQGR